MNNPAKIWRDQKKDICLLGKKGKVISWSFVRSAPDGFEDQAPFYVAVIELEGRIRVEGQVIEVLEEKLKIGQKVIGTIRRLKKPDSEGVIEYGIKFRVL